MLTHGTGEAVRLHHELGEALCSPCLLYLRDLTSEGWAPPSWFGLTAAERRAKVRREALGPDERNPR